MNIFNKLDIGDVQEFYLKKFLTSESFDYISKGQDFRHDLDMSKFHWLFSNIPDGSRVLDLGCGCGNLNFLKSKSCYLAGVDISPLNCERALKNGYDHAICADLKEVPLQSDSFDVVISIDVMGHIGFEDKDKCIFEMKRILKKGGITIHGIESDNVNYSSLSKKELKQFVEVDGHIGMEGQKENEERFKKYFDHVDSQFQFNIPMTAAEILKQQKEYPEKFQIDPYIINRINKFDGHERYIWNLAMGFVFERIMEFRPYIKDQWGFLLLRASEDPLKKDNYGSAEISGYLRPVSFGSGNDLYHILNGFHDPEGDGSLENSYRWTGSEAEFQVPSSEKYQLCIGASRPEGAKPAKFTVKVQNGGSLSLKSSDEKMVFDIKGPMGNSTDPVVVTIKSNTFIPERLAVRKNENGDKRELGIRLYWIDWI